MAQPQEVAGILHSSTASAIIYGVDVADNATASCEAVPCEETDLHTTSNRVMAKNVGTPHSCANDARRFHAVAAEYEHKHGLTLSHREPGVRVCMRVCASPVTSVVTGVSICHCFVSQNDALLEYVSVCVLYVDVCMCVCVCGVCLCDCDKCHRGWGGVPQDSV